MQKTLKLKSHQVDFLSAREMYVGLFGGVGNGKTFAAALRIIELATQNPDNLCLVGRLTYPELRDSTKEEFMRTLRQLYPSQAYTENKAENAITFWNKSVVIFRHLDNTAALLGPNLGAFYIDQAEEVDEDAFHTLQGRLRRQGMKQRHGFVTGNPHGHNWVYYKFGMDKARDARDWTHNTDYRMITAPTFANAENLPVGYIDQLRRSYSPEWFLRYVEGSWDAFEGQIFDITKVTGFDQLPEIIMVLTACDPAISKEDTACDTAFCTLGVGVNGHIYDLETIAKKISFLETLSEAEAILSRQKSNYLGVENTSYQEALAESCKHYFPNVNVESLKADKDKFRRAKSVSHIISKGLFHTNNRELISDMAAFDPDAKGKAKKDRVDALVHCLHMVQKYAPIRVPEVDPLAEFKGLNSHQAWFKQTRDYARRQLEQGDEEVEEYSGSSISQSPDFY